MITNKKKKPQGQPSYHQFISDIQGPLRTLLPSISWEALLPSDRYNR